MYALTVDRRRSRHEGPALDMAGSRDRLNQQFPEAVLAWHRAGGRVAIPRSGSPAHLAENLAALGPSTLNAPHLVVGSALLLGLVLLALGAPQAVGEPLGEPALHALGRHQHQLLGERVGQRFGEQRTQPGGQRAGRRQARPRNTRLMPPLTSSILG
mgnify:CR=1 FL=1